MSSVLAIHNEADQADSAKLEELFGPGSTFVPGKMCRSGSCGCEFLQPVDSHTEALRCVLPGVTSPGEGAICTLYVARKAKKAQPNGERPSFRRVR